MSSTFGGLNILSRSLYAQQASLNTVGHNIANAGTDGYSRQRVNLVTMAPAGEVYGSRGSNQAGTGVAVGAITRARDIFTDKQLWKESATLGYSQTSSEALSRMEGVFNEPSDTGVQTVLNQFWSSWQTLSTNASDSGARTAVAQRGVAVANAIQHAARQLTDTVENINSEVVSGVSNINQITSSIYKLNQQIAFTEVGGNDHANDLRDSRDLLVDQLSKLVNVSVNEDSSGNYTIKASTDLGENVPFGSVTLVDASGNYKLGTKLGAPEFGYEVMNVVDANGKELNFTNGAVKALLDSRDSETTGIKGYMTKLNDISKFLLTDFNDVHKAGVGTDNSTGVNFFGDKVINYSQTATTPWKPALGGSWIDSLQVNLELLAGAEGLNKIAAKTVAGKVAITQSNSSGGGLTITGAVSLPATSQDFVVKIDTINPAGKVLTVSVGGVIYNPTVGLDTDPNTFTLLNGANFQIATNVANADTNTYSFILDPQGNAAGDNAILLGKRLKTDNVVSLGGTSLDAFYSSMIGALGVQSQDAQRLNTNQKTVIDHLSNLRESTSGVNMDEEMTDMIRFQKGYNAAARVLTAMDEMLDKLINGTGVVGR